MIEDKNIVEKNSSVIIKINPKIFPLDVVYAASYVFIDKCYVKLDGDPKKEIQITITMKENTSLINIENEFSNQLINYAFYKKQTENKSEIRNAIMKRALATVELSGSSEHEGDSEEIIENSDDIIDSDIDFIDDPEGIAIPWEEKFGKNEGKEEKSDNSDC